MENEPLPDGTHQFMPLIPAQYMIGAIKASLTAVDLSLTHLDKEIQRLMDNLVVSASGHMSTPLVMGWAISSVEAGYFAIVYVGPDSIKAAPEDGWPFDIIKMIEGNQFIEADFDTNQFSQQAQTGAYYTCTISLNRFVPK